MYNLEDMIYIYLSAKYGYLIIGWKFYKKNCYVRIQISITYYIYLFERRDEILNQ